MSRFCYVFSLSCIGFVVSNIFLYRGRDSANNSFSILKFHKLFLIENIPIPKAFLSCSKTYPQMLKFISIEVHMYSWCTSMIFDQCIGSTPSLLHEYGFVDIASKKTFCFAIIMKVSAVHATWYFSKGTKLPCNLNLPSSFIKR